MLMVLIAALAAAAAPSPPQKAGRPKLIVLQLQTAGGVEPATG